MDDLKMVEELVKKTNVTYTEARDALMASDWNMLNSIVYLENKGKRVKGARLRAVLSSIWKCVESVFGVILSTSVNVFCGGAKKVSLPLILVLIFAEILLPIAIAAFFFGCTYSIERNGSQTGVFTVQNPQGAAQNGNGGFGFNMNPER